MGLAKLSDGTSGTQKQTEEKRWTKKGAAIVAKLLKTRAVSTGILQPDSEPEYTICCITDVFTNNRLFTCVTADRPFTLKTSEWEEQSPGSFLVGVISEEGTEVHTTLLPDTKIHVYQSIGITDTYDAETILSLENILPADWEKAEEIKKDIKERLATAIGIPYVPGVTTWH